MKRPHVCVGERERKGHEIFQLQSRPLGFPVAQMVKNLPAVRKTWV